MSGIGIFLCQGRLEGLDLEIGDEDTRELSGEAKIYRHPALCSTHGNRYLENVVRAENLGGLLAICPFSSLYEESFRRIVSELGIIPGKSKLLCIPVKEWRNGGRLEILRKAIADISKSEEAFDFNRPFSQKVLVIGGGISGITASIDLANAGYDVVLVERLPSIGGRMLQLSETFPTLDCAQCTLTPRTVEAGQHPRIKLLTFSEVEDVGGTAGDFVVRIRRKASYVKWEKCTGCGLCQQKCPTKRPSEFDRGMGTAKAIYTLSPQAVPNKPVIDPSVCRYLREGKCRICEKICPVGAIDYEQKDSYMVERVGAIIVAVGYDLLPKDRFGEYGYGQIPDVIDGLAFERLNSASGPTSGEIRRPSDGRIPKEVVFIQCAGSRDPERYFPYCSRVCCMYTAKHARLYKHKVPEGRVYIFYMDIRSTGKGYEEFIQQSTEEAGLLYLRGRVSRLYREADKVVVWGMDTLTGKKVEIEADLVVLATAIMPRPEARALADKLGITTDEYGFFCEAQRKVRPVDTRVNGIFIAGCCTGPMDIADAVAHGSASASKVQAFFARQGNQRKKGNG